ncbi:protein-methionine-sulfoxide reductase catalytic subunit MsrP, partial [Herbaspirillum sp. HC18]
KWKVDRPLTAEQLNLTYNNFYEFGSHKEISDAAQGLKIRPWVMRIDGLVEKPFEIGIDDLIRRMQLEERVYRHRCVEAWSMTVPWTGFQMAELVKIAKPLASAAFLRMETFHDPKVASGQQQSWYPWPYVEGITLAEATNDLAFLA